MEIIKTNIKKLKNLKGLIKRRVELILKLLVLTFVLNSCVENPKSPTVSNPNTNLMPPKGLIVLCEGLWGMDNSTIDVINQEMTNYTKQAYQKLNNNNILGDIANDILITGDTLIICVSTSKYIELVNLKNGKTINRFTLNGNYYPRRMSKFKNYIYITDLYGDCLHRLDLNTSQLEQNILKVGAAPEYITNDSTNLFVVNSGYGDYKAKEIGAGELWVLSLDNHNVNQKIYIGPNPIEVVYDNKNSKLYASYIHLPSKKDSIGGIVELEINPNSTTNTLKKSKEWRTKPSKITLYNNQLNSNLMYIDEKGLKIINLNTDTIQTLVQNNNQLDKWYGLALSEDKNTLIICNARNHTIDGEIMIYNFNSIWQKSQQQIYNTLPFKTFKSSINPSKVLWY